MSFSDLGTGFNIGVVPFSLLGFHMQTTGNPRIFILTLSSLLLLINIDNPKPVGGIKPVHT